MSIKLIALIALVSSTAFSPQLFADDDAMAAESATYCASTVNKDRPTAPSVIIDKVNEACALLTKEGPAAFPKFSGKGSPFIYEGTYITVQGIADGMLYVHPLKNKMVGQKMMALKDAKGKRFFSIISDLAREKGDGWVEYYWAKPGTQDVTRKITYIKKCTMANGVEVAVGSGIYNYSDADVAKLELH